MVGVAGLALAAAALAAAALAAAALAAAALVAAAVEFAGLPVGAVASVPASASAFHDSDVLLPAPDHRPDIEHPYIDDSGLARTWN